MKLSISNIAWDSQYDDEMYALLVKHGYNGLEIAPTRIIPLNPYDRISEIIKWKNAIKSKYNLEVSSMQSIWFGRKERLFGENNERQILLQYSKKAIDFASEIGCNNLVFGCPKNRVIEDLNDYEKAYDFFKELGDYAYNNGTIFSIEPNPPIYNTNYINDTIEALCLIKKVNSKGFKLNFDFGTFIENNEDIKELENNVKYINHVHISEPGLKMIENRDSHKYLFEILKREEYENYISIEMSLGNDIDIIEKTMIYVKEIFG